MIRALADNRVTFDPDLSPRIVRRMRADPRALRPAAPRALRRPRWWFGAVTAAVAAVPGAVLSLLSVPVAYVFLALGALVTGGAVGFLAHQKFREDFDGGWDGVFLFLCAYALSINLALLLWVLAVEGLRWILGPLNDLAPGEPAMSLLWFLLCAGTTVFLPVRRPGDAADLAARHRDRHILRADLTYAAEARLLATLQQATARAENAHRVLGSAVGVKHVLPLLRSEEWRLAKECRHLDRLRGKLVRAGHEADTERLRSALAPQWEALKRAHDSLRQEIQALDTYGRQLQQAVDAHHEWEKFQRIADQAGDFSDLAPGSPSGDSTVSEALDDSLTGAEAARAAREELIQRTAKATSDFFQRANE